MTIGVLLNDYMNLDNDSNASGASNDTVSLSSSNFTEGSAMGNLWNSFLTVGDNPEASETYDPEFGTDDIQEAIEMNSQSTGRGESIDLSGLIDPLNALESEAGAPQTEFGFGGLDVMLQDLGNSSADLSEPNEADETNEANEETEAVEGQSAIDSLALGNDEIFVLPDSAVLLDSESGEINETFS